MTTEFEASLKRLNWFGTKSLIARFLCIKPVNSIFRKIAKLSLPARTAARFPVSVPKVEYRLLGGERITLLDPARDEVARDIFWGNGRCISAGEQHTLDCVETLCKDAHLFLDIGAYSGLFALIAVAAQPRLKAITFEIVPENHLLVMRNIVENDLIGRIDARLCGLSDRAGTITVAPSLHLDRLASSISISSDFSAGVRVPIETLDNAIGETVGPIVMKIDVEGFETAVVRGGRLLFERYKPDVICEILPGSTDYRELETILRSLGYHYYQIDDNGLTRHESIDPTTGGRDWLLTARNDLPASLNLS